MNPWSPLPSAVASPVSRRRGVLTGAVCGGLADAVLAGVAWTMFEAAGAIGVAAAGPAAVVMGAGLGWVATGVWARRPLLWLLGVIAAFATAPLTGVLLELLQAPADAGVGWFVMSLFGAVMLAPGLLIAGVVAGEAVWRVTRAR